MGGKGKDIGKHLVKFREFHTGFYKEVRDFLVRKKLDFVKNDGLEKLVNDKRNDPNIKLDDDKIQYSALLEYKIRKFSINQVADFLRDYHSLPDKKSEKDKLPFLGIVFLHSREFGEGNKINIIFGDWKSEEEGIVTNNVFNLRHAVSHLLGETMWRFFEPGQQKIPCLYFDEGNILKDYPNSFCFPIPSKVIRATYDDVENLKELIEEKNEDWKNLLFDKLTKVSEYLNRDGIWKLISGAKNEFESWFPKDGDQSKLMFLIDGVREEYIVDSWNSQTNEIIRLLANPIRQAIISKLKNIFYIPDVHRSSVTGGLVCELHIDDVYHVRKIEKIVEDLQWIFSNYVFAPISSCETEFGSGIEFTYSNNFFSSKEGFNLFKKDIYKKVEESTFCHVKELNEPIKYFFEAVSEERGQYVRGYTEISKKVFIAVCKIWNTLKIYEIAGGIEIADLKELEADINRFKIIRYYQPSLALLWDALDFEGTLKNVPSYREHFIHSFHIFCLGIWLMSYKLFPYYSFINSESNSYDENFVRKWFLASLWHDISYAMQKLAYISNIFVKKLITHGYERKKRKLLVPISPSWGHLLLAKDFYNLLLGKDDFLESFKKAVSFEKSYYEKIKEDIRKEDEDVKNYISEYCSNVVLEKMLNDAEHGVLSGLIFYHQLCNVDIEAKKEEVTELSKYAGNEMIYFRGDSEEKTYLEGIVEHISRFQPVNKPALMQAIVAMMLHGCYEWKWEDSILGDKDILEGKTVFRIDVKEAPLCHLLVLCDCFVQAGREFPDEIRSLSNKQTEIKFAVESQYNINDAKDINFALEYNNSTEKMAKIMVSYFEPVRSVLNLYKTGGNIRIRCILKDKSGESEPEEKYFIFSL